MFWSKHKRSKNIEASSENEYKTENAEENEADMSVLTDEAEESVSEEEILSILENDDDSEETGAEEIQKEEKVTKLLTSADEMIEFINSKSVGRIQYMRKSDFEAFEIGDAHLRIAEIWGSVSMGREYKPSEYARIMLAAEVRANPENFYILPSLSDEEIEKSILTFCDEHYAVNGKKYLKDRHKFAKVVKENDDEEEWLSFNRTLTAKKVLDFCKENNIEFLSEEISSEDEQ